jgi:hypothetical protein
MGTATGETQSRRLSQSKALHEAASQQHLSGLRPEAIVPADPKFITQSKSGRRVDSTRCYHATHVGSSMQEEAVAVDLRDTLASEAASAWLQSMAMSGDDVEIIKRCVHVLTSTSPDQNRCDGPRSAMPSSIWHQNICSSCN